MRRFFEILSIIYILSSVESQQSCSDISSYFQDFYGTYGQVHFDHVPLQQSTFIEVTLSVAARLQNYNDWKITLASTNPYNDLVNDRGLTVKFIPLIKNPLPIVTAVYLNNNQLCSSPPARGMYVSTIKLSYTYTINGIPQNYNVNTPSRISQKPFTYYQTEQPASPAPLPTRPPQQKLPQTKPPQTQAPQILLNQKFDETPFDNNKAFVCGIRRQSQSVVSFVIGGQAAKRNDFPWLAAFYYGQNGFICGGTLLSTRIVVTAAHCVQDKQNVEKRSTYDSSFYLGKYNIRDLNEKDYITSGVDDFILHPSWNPLDQHYEADLCVVLLTKVIKFNNNIIPLCIWPQTNSHADMIGQQGLIAGWGITETGSISELPMYVSLPVVDDLTCVRERDIFAQITTKKTFCVGDKSGKSPCNGDSGGAFAIQNSKDHKYYFRGIVSSGIVSNTGSGCDATTFAIFTDVAQYTNWIMSYVNVYG